MPARATKAAELIKRLTAAGNAEELDEWGIRRLTRDAHALMDSDAVAAHTILGGIAALKGDADDVRKHYDIALQLPTSSNETTANYAASLSKAGEMTEAFQTILRAHEGSPDDLKVLDAAISLSVQSAEFRNSRSLYHRWNKLCPDRPMKDEAIMSKAVEAVESGAFSEEGAQRAVRLAHQVRLNANVRQAGSAICALHGERDSFLFEIHVHASAKRAAELNQQFADRIVTDEELMSNPGRKFVLMFIGTKTHGSDSRRTP